MKKTFLSLITFLAVSSYCQAATIAEIASNNQDFTILTQALKATGLDKALAQDGSFTVFAPTDEAFKKLPKGTIASLLKPEAKEKLATILKYHVVGDKVSGRQAVGLDKAPTLAEQELKISFEKASLYINDAKVLNTDIEASNGIIHVIDSVLMPQLSSSDAKSMACQKILLEAIDSGVDLFNDGNTKACEAIYKVAVLGIYNIKPPTLEKKELKALAECLGKVNSSDDSRANSWALREVIDTTMKSLKE